MKKEIELFGKSNLWIDRDISWLQFNQRVLLQTKRNDMPISKRISFIGIAANNMIEFMSVRLSTHVNGKKKVLPLVKEINRQKDLIHEFFMETNSELHMIDSMELSDLSGEKEEKIAALFEKEIYPALTPIAVASNKEIPIFSEQDVNFFIELHDKEDKDNKLYCFLQIPHEIPRVFSMHKKKYLVEEIIESQLCKIFNNMEIDSYLLFSVYNNFDDSLNSNKIIPIVSRVAQVLDRRRTNKLVALDIMTYDDNKKIINKLRKLLKVPMWATYIRKKSSNDTIGLQFMQSVSLKDKEKYESYNKSFKPRKIEGDIYELIDEHDVVLHHPYDSYDTVLKFIENASRDPSTISIKQTLYRISSENSPIIESLCYAAKHGIQVTVMIELLARFDERRNISLIKSLKKAGVNMVYSLESMKTHCKMCLVVKAGKNGIRTYAHVGTGNYNEKTAKLYTDISFLTSKRKVCAELNSVFAMITGFGKPYELKHVAYSPYTLRTTIVDEINRVLSAEGEKRKVLIKCNSLSDPDMVEFILKAAEEHPDVTFMFIVRGICSLPPRKNIIIKSIIGRFLEHSRIYSFYDGTKYSTWISSADMLTRNLDRRIETLVHLTDKKAAKNVLKIFIDSWLDTANSWTLDGDLNWYQMDTNNIYTNVQNDYTLD